MSGYISRKSGESILTNTLTTNQITSTVIIPHFKKKSFPNNTGTDNRSLLNRFLDDVGYDELFPNIQEVNDINVIQ